MFVVARGNEPLSCCIDIYTLHCIFTMPKLRYNYVGSRLNIISEFSFSYFLLHFPRYPIPNDTGYLHLHSFCSQPISCPNNPSQQNPSCLRVSKPKRLTLTLKYYFAHHSTRITAHEGRIKPASPSLLQPLLAQRRVAFTTIPSLQFPEKMNTVIVLLPTPPSFLSHSSDTE
jgi:hypothetical protein